MNNRPSKNSWRREWFDIVFESHTKAGKTFDVILLIAIITSVITIALESVSSLREHFALGFRILEWSFTIVFTIEYIVRIFIVEKKLKYVLSTFGLIDLISILPTYFALFVAGAQYFLIVRSLRLLRVFRVLKLIRYLSEARVLADALRASSAKIIVFLASVICGTFLMGTAMYMVEGPEHGFTDIPTSIYWCIVTLTTVGYGDLVPVTPLGRALASIIMILGYGVIAVPTGIVTSELSRNVKPSAKRCPNCKSRDHELRSNYCKYCGTEL